MRRLLFVLGASAMVACNGAIGGSDGPSGSDDSGEFPGDSSSDDSTSATLDTSSADADATTPPSDTSPPDDSMPSVDTAIDSVADAITVTDVATDSSTVDSTLTDSTIVDSGLRDSAIADSGLRDSAVVDSGPLDTGVDSAVPDASVGSAPMIGPCRIFPPDNPWNTDVSGYALNPKSATYLSNMAPTVALHPDWGGYSDPTASYGIPYNTGTGATPVRMNWTASWGPTESDKLPCAGGSYDFCYPIPSTCKIEGGSSATTGSDRHLLFLDTAGAPNNCTLYEIYNAQNWVGPGWTAQNGAIFPLGVNTLRPDGWTSADAAGLPVLPGLIRYDEVKAGAIKHAIRFTMNNTFIGYIHPATHGANSTIYSNSYPPMGLRLRLKSSVSLSGFTGDAKVIVTAMQKYGLILADNGSDWYIGGDSDDRWNTGTTMDDIIAAFNKLHGSDFEAVDTGPVSTTGL